MTPSQAQIAYEQMLALIHTDLFQAECIARGLATAALLALDSGDIPRAQAIGKLALDAQEAVGSAHR